MHISPATCVLLHEKACLFTSLYVLDGPTETTYFDWLLNKGHILFRAMFESIDLNTHSPNGQFL